jgi:hypothetical protein
MMCDRSHLPEQALESRARRAAQRVGFARKSRWHLGTIDNHGGFMLVEPSRNVCINGSRFDLTAEDVIELTQGEQS